MKESSPEFQHYLEEEVWFEDIVETYDRVFNQEKKYMTTGELREWLTDQKLDALKKGYYDTWKTELEEFIDKKINKIGKRE